MDHQKHFTFEQPVLKFENRSITSKLKKKNEQVVRRLLWT
jgi:hypothetical protein